MLPPPRKEAVQLFRGNFPGFAANLTQDALSSSNSLVFSLSKLYTGRTILAEGVVI